MPAEAQADAAMGDGASQAPAGTAPTPSRGRRPNGRGYNGGWNAQSDKMLQSAVLAARLGGGGEGGGGNDGGKHGGVAFPRLDSLDGGRGGGSNAIGPKVAKDVLADGGLPSLLCGLFESRDGGLGISSFALYIAFADIIAGDTTYSTSFSTFSTFFN